MTSIELESALLKNEITVIYFWSPNCSKCKLYGPSIESFSKNKGLTLIKVDTSEEMDVTLKYDVMSLPTVIFFRKGQEKIRVTSANISMAEIEKSYIKITHNS